MIFLRVCKPKNELSHCHTVTDENFFRSRRKKLPKNSKCGLSVLYLCSVIRTTWDQKPEFLTLM